MIKLRTKSIEIDVPANKVPSVEISPPTPDNEKSSVQSPLNKTTEDASVEETRSEYENDDNSITDAKSQQAGGGNDNGDEVVITQVDAEDQVNVHENNVATSDESGLTQGLDNVQTVDLDDIGEHGRTYGLAVVLNRKDQSKIQ